MENKRKTRSPDVLPKIIKFFVLSLCWICGFCSRLFSIIRFESIIHEFDPWFNFRATVYMVNNGFYKFINWFDDKAWYPLGRVVGGTVYPGLMITSGAIHYILTILNIPVDIRDICVFLAPTFSGLTTLTTYLLTTELWNSGAGLIAAFFIAFVPGYTSRSVAGSYDNEGIAIFAMQFTFYSWIKAVKSGSIFWSCMTSLSYFYMVSAWGGYVYIINLIPLHVFVLMIMGRFSNRHFVSYTTFYILGLLLSMQIPFVGFQPIRTSEHMAATGVFILSFITLVVNCAKGSLNTQEMKWFFLFMVSGIAGLMLVTIAGLTSAGLIAPWTGRFYSLWDTGYAKWNIPIIASVSEHQPTTWFALFFDLHVLSCIFPVGLFYCFKFLNDERMFAILYAVSAAYFAGVMVRLILTLTPIVCVLSGIAFSHLIKSVMEDMRYAELQMDIESNTDNSDDSDSIDDDTNDDNSEDDDGDHDNDDGYNLNNEEKSQNLHKKYSINRKRQAKELTDRESLGSNIRTSILVVVLMLTILFIVHSTWVTGNAYSSPSVVVASYNADGTRELFDDFREGYAWLSHNTDENAAIMSWWDYGYQIAGLANRTTIVDNNTWNNTHIALVAKAMVSNEKVAYEIMCSLGVDYVLIIFGGLTGYSSDDINKFLWMVRIAEAEYPQEIQEKNYLNTEGRYTVGSDAPDSFVKSLMYKLSYHNFNKVQNSKNHTPGFDKTRGRHIDDKDISLEYLEEAFTSEHWMMRIYRVKKPVISNRPVIPVAKRKVKRRNICECNNGYAV